MHACITLATTSLDRSMVSGLKDGAAAEEPGRARDVPQVCIPALRRKNTCISVYGEANRIRLLIIQTPSADKLIMRAVEVSAISTQDI